MNVVVALLLIFQVGGPVVPVPNWTVYLRRAGPLQIGMSISEARRVLGDPQAYLSYLDKEPDNSPCAYMETSAVPRGVGLMFQKGRLVRIDVSEPGIRTASEIGVGDTEEAVQRRYPGRLTVEPHFYTPETGHYLKYRPVNAADRDYGMVFETNNGRVTMFRTGTLAAVALIEGCS